MFLGNFCNAKIWALLEQLEAQNTFHPLQEFSFFLVDRINKRWRKTQTVFLAHMSFHDIRPDVSPYKLICNNYIQIFHSVRSTSYKCIPYQLVYVSILVASKWEYIY